MIIRCKNCVSAFAVDDAKVADRKFAFTCPKCGIENIIDNRKVAATVEFSEPVSDDLFDDLPEQAAPVSKKTARDIPEENIFQEEPAAEKTIEDDFAVFDEEPAAEKTIEDEFAVFDEELADEKPAPSKKQPLNLDIEEAAEEPVDKDFTFDEEVIFDEPVAGIKPEAKAVPAGEPTEDFLMDELDIELGDEAEKAGSDIPEPDFAEIDIDGEFADFDIEGETKPAAVSDRDKKLTEQDEIDAMFAASAPESGAGKEGISDELEAFDIDIEETQATEIREEELAEDLTAGEMEALDLLEEPREHAAVKGGEVSEDDITIDIDSLDIDFEEPEPAAVKAGAAKKAGEPEDMLFDIDVSEAVPAKTVSARKVMAEDESLFDIEIPEAVPVETVSAKKSAIAEEPLVDFDLDIEEPVKPVSRQKKPVEPEDDLTLDMDSLDIDIEEPVHESIKNLPEKRETAAQVDDGITLDVDSLDIDLDETSFDVEPARDELSEEEIEIDLDSLDFDTEETKPVPAGKQKNVREIIQEQAGQGDDEDIRLNLDELDIDIEEISEKDMDFVKKPAAAPAGRKKGIIEEAPEDEDESITIDLDTLDIDVAENAPVVESEISEEDEKLTLEDAGMTFDELTTSEKRELKLDLDDEEEIKLTLDEVDPDMKLDQIGEIAPVDEPLLVDTLDELPEISLEETEPVVQVQRKDYKRIVPEEDLDIDTIVETEPAGRTGGLGRVPVAGPHGSGRATIFTIDFSLKYSRIGALLRLLQVYTISMIPHMVVLFIYTLLSAILGFINQIVVLSTGRCVEDFSQITENTLRYYLYVESCVTGIVEDRPEFAGRERLDHQMQLNITYPFKYSKLLAGLRISVAGIFIVSLPHIIMLLFITCFMPFVYLAGIIWVIITGRWPNPLFQILTMYFRYMARISSFMTGLTDQYPPFRFE